MNLMLNMFAHFVRFNDSFLSFDLAGIPTTSDSLLFKATDYEIQSLNSKFE
jgi:hypothetical protein